MPEFTADTAGMGTLRLLEAVRHADWPIRFYQAGSQRDVREGRRDARSPRRRRSTRAARTPIAKVFAHWMTVQYREAYGLFASQRDPVQPRVAAARRDVRDPQGHPRRSRPSSPGTQEQALPRQPRRAARLGLRQGIRRGDVADAPAARAGRLRDRDRRDAHASASSCEARSAWSGSTGSSYVRDRPALLPAHRGRRAVRRRVEGRAGARLAAADARSDELVRIMLEARSRERRARSRRHVLAGRSRGAA